MMNIKQTFSDIYNSNYWGDSESVSGPGSTLYYTEEIRKSLSQIINELSIESMFDAPCGDFNWMQHVVNKDKINYVGGDIVPEIVISNQKKYQNQTFKEFNIIEDDFPSADLWICRDCFFHLPEADIIKSLKNFVKSDIKYLFTTTHINDNEFMNTDIKTGGFRKIDLFLPPYNFPKDVLYKVKDYVPGFPKREMILITKDQLLKIL